MRCSFISSFSSSSYSGLVCTLTLDRNKKHTTNEKKNYLLLNFPLLPLEAATGCYNNLLRFCSSFPGILPELLVSRYWPDLIKNFKVYWPINVVDLMANIISLSFVWLILSYHRICLVQERRSYCIVWIIYGCVFASPWAKLSITV